MFLWSFFTLSFPMECLLRSLLKECLLQSASFGYLTSATCNIGIFILMQHFLRLLKQKFACGSVEFGKLYIKAISLEDGSILH